MEGVDLIEIILDKLHDRYQKAVKYDVDSQWRLGFEVAEGIVIDTVLENMGYDPKRVGRNGEELVKRLIKETQNKFEP